MQLPLFPLPGLSILCCFPVTKTVVDQLNELGTCFANVLQVEDTKKQFQCFVDKRGHAPGVTLPQMLQLCLSSAIDAQGLFLVDFFSFIFYVFNKVEGPGAAVSITGWVLAVTNNRN